MSPEPEHITLDAHAREEDTQNLIALLKDANRRGKTKLKRKFPKFGGGKTDTRPLVQHGITTKRVTLQYSLVRLTGPDEPQQTWAAVTYAGDQKKNNLKGKGGFGAVYEINLLIVFDPNTDTLTYNRNPTALKKSLIDKSRGFSAKLANAEIAQTKAMFKGAKGTIIESTTGIKKMYLAMDLFDYSLAELIKQIHDQERTVPLQERLAIALGILKAYQQFRQTTGKIHWDINPGNILFKESGEIVFCDIAGAKKPGEEPDFYSPEYFSLAVHQKARNGQLTPKITEKADVFALGVVLAELMGLNPTEARCRRRETAQNFSHRVIEEPLTWPEKPKGAGAMLISLFKAMTSDNLDVIPTLEDVITEIECYAEFQAHLQHVDAKKVLETIVNNISTGNLGSDSLNTRWETSTSKRRQDRTQQIMLLNSALDALLEQQKFRDASAENYYEKIQLIIDVLNDNTRLEALAKHRHYTARLMQKFSPLEDGAGRSAQALVDSKASVPDIIHLIAEISTSLVGHTPLGLDLTSSEFRAEGSGTGVDNPEYNYSAFNLNCS